MKIIKLISLFVILLAVPAIGIAANSDTKGNQDNQEQDGRKTNQDVIRPDGAMSSQQQDNQREPSVSEEKREAVEIQRPTNNLRENAEDSLEDGSVSKYNFIFYFLYKFKYDTEESL